MLDWVVVLTPLLALGALLLLGFAGCMSKPPRPENPLRRLKLRLPI